MNKSIAKLVKWIFVTIGVAWMAGMGWQQFGTLTSDQVLTPHSEAVRERMDSECSGSFERRYDCKESIAIGTVRHSLINMVMRIGIVVSMPILLTMAFRSLNKQGRNRPVSRSFPAATQRRTTWSRPTAAAAAARPSEPEPEEEQPPEDDMSWKKSAQRHVTQVVRPPDDPSS